MTKIILPGAWELTKDVQRDIFGLYVPNSWRQIANSLAQKRAKKGYRGVPVYSLDLLIAASFPKIIQTVRNGWQKPGVPWLFATETADLSNLGDLIKDWLRSEFSWCLGEDEVNSVLDNLNDDDWHWEDPQTYSLLHPQNQAEKNILYQAIPDYLAQEFLEKPTVTFGADDKYKLTFYRVVRLKGAELMSWPPDPVVLLNSQGEVREDRAYISFVISFKLQTVPWRSQPIIYHELSIRRWFAEPLIREKKNNVPYKGATAYIGDRRRWLDGQRQPFCFTPLIMKRQGKEEKELKWPQAINELLLINDCKIPDPIELVKNPTYNWMGNGTISSGIEAAISYDTRHTGEIPSKPGVSLLDLYSLDKAIQERLPVQRVGEAVKVSGSVKPFWPLDKPKKPKIANIVDDQNQATKEKKPKKVKVSDELSTTMLRPKIAAPAVFRETENTLCTILILWETKECRDALIAEICQLLSLSPTGEENIYKGSHGSLCIKTQHVQDLTQNFNVDDTSVPGKNRQKRRDHLLEERIKKIVSFLPAPEGLSGTIIEIKPKPFIPENDAKLAWRIAPMQKGYVNQHIHRITFTTKEGKEKITNSGRERVKRAVSDLLRQCGILPAPPLIKLEIDGIEPHVWLTCFYVLRRTKKTTASNNPNTAVLMVRVNPVTGKVEMTTPSLLTKWVSYPVGLKHLMSEKWNPDSYFNETTEDIGDEQQPWDKEREQRLINKFVADCLRDCLNTPIADNKSPKVLFMAEAQNARLKLPWLQNPNLSDALKQLQITKPGEINRLWIVRLRIADSGEVPVAIVKDSPGSKTSGLFCWQDVCDDGENTLYLSVRKPLTTEQDLLRKSQSRLDNGNRQAGKARLLEIAIAPNPEIAPARLACFVHSLRSRWPYFADDVSLPFPFPFATKAKEYAVSAKDTVEASESNESLMT